MNFFIKEFEPCKPKIRFLRHFWHKSSFLLLLFLGALFNVAFGQQDLPLLDLDHYLSSCGYSLSPGHSKVNEGYSSVAQRKAFFDDLQKMPHVKKILEVGFNAGHSCELFLNSPFHPKVVSFDINLHSYTKPGVEFMQKKYGDRFEFVQGDSSIKLIEYANEHFNEKFDLIFIDGCHTFDGCVSDILKCQRFAHKDTVLWIDDYYPYGVKIAVDSCVERGLISILDVKSVSDESGARSWAIARYLY
jgi:hypothetical protein